METTIFTKAPVYTNKKGEVSSLPEIIKNKEIISVTIAYLSKEKKVKADGLKGLFGLKEKRQDEKELIINDQQGITVYYENGIPSATIRFWDKKEFQKLDDGDYDEKTLWKRFVMTMIHPYQINFHIGNLKKVDWR